MKETAPLSIIANVSDIPVYLAVICFSLAFTLFVFLIIRQQFMNLYGRWDARFASRDEELLMELIGTGNVSILSRLHRSRSTRDMIVKIASKLQGDSVHQLVGAYSFMGFAMDDFHVLAHGNLLDRMQALARCRMLKLPLPNEAWVNLLQHPDQTFRWAAMEYLILVKAKDSLLWLLYFLQHPRNQEAGMALHLCCCFAKSSPMAFAFLLDHSSDPFLAKIWMQTLALYPVTGADEVILEKLGANPPVDFLCVGLRALAAAPSYQTKIFIIKLASHRDWNVRRLVADLLNEFQDQESADALASLAEDLNFPVRLQAVETLSVLGDFGKVELRKIAETEGHPSHQLVLKVYSQDETERRSA